MTTDRSLSATERDLLITSNLALVGHIVTSMAMRIPTYVDRGELTSAGHYALVKAAQTYDPASGVPFARWAALGIRGRIVDELRGMDWISRGARRRVKTLEKVIADFTQTHSRKPSRQELAELAGIPLEEVDATLADGETKVLGLDAFGDGVTVANMVVDDSPGPEASLLSRERIQFMLAGVESLNPRLRHIIEGTFFHDRSDVELADDLGVTQSRISQMRSEALALLRDGINANLDPDLVPEPELPGGVAHRRRLAYYAELATRAASGAIATTAELSAAAGDTPATSGVARDAERPVAA